MENLPEGAHQIGPGMMRIRPAVANGDLPDEHHEESPAAEALPNGDAKPASGMCAALMVSLKFAHVLLTEGLYAMLLYTDVWH